MLSSKKGILEISRDLSFSKVLNKKELPGYIKHYVETMLYLQTIKL